MKKYSTKAYYNYAKRMLEGEAVNVDSVDPDVKALFDSVAALEAKKPGSSEKFLQIAQNKYGITSPNALKSGMSAWLKYTIGGISIAGFISSIFLAIKKGLSLFNEYAVTSDYYIHSDSVVSRAHLAGLSNGVKGMAVAFCCIVASFIFYKIFRLIQKTPTVTTESYNKPSNKRQLKLKRDLAIVESELFVKSFSRLIESDEVASTTQMDVTIQKSEGICSRMFSWVKEKVLAGWRWIKKHPYITIAILIVIGFVMWGSRQYFASKAAQAATVASGTPQDPAKAIIAAIGNNGNIATDASSTTINAIANTSEQKMLNILTHTQKINPSLAKEIGKGLKDIVEKRPNSNIADTILKVSGRLGNAGKGIVDVIYGQ